MAKFKFTVDREITSWVKDIYEIEAESQEEAESILENNDFDISSIDEANVVEEGLESDIDSDPFHQHVIITNEEGNEVFNGTI